MNPQSHPAPARGTPSSRADTTDFLSAVRASGLVAPARLAMLRGLSPRAQARQLLDRGWLTPFQLDFVRRGHGAVLTIGPYQLMSRIGSGGMGEVFKARHRLMDRLAAVKVMRPKALQEAGGAARFVREVEAAARLDHPNVIHAYDAGRQGRAYYLAMEYVEGADLGQVVARDGPLPVAKACDYARQAALGLQHAFACGVVHRDLKPSNLLLSTEGVVKVLDLGLARFAGGEVLTRTGQVLGTADYMAPEQALGAGAADTRSDLYSLGCTLYFLLAGRPPFAGGPAVDKLLRHLREEPPPLQAARPGVPAAVAAVVRRLMAKHPDARYRTPDEAAAALGASLA